MTNEDIARKIGFEHRTGEAGTCWDKPVIKETWFAPDGTNFYDSKHLPTFLPDFLNSMDACEKWVIPWLREQGYGSFQFGVLDNGYACFIWNFSSNKFNAEIGEGPTISEALCNTLEDM